MMVSDRFNYCAQLWRAFLSLPQDRLIKGPWVRSLVLKQCIHKDLKREEGEEVEEEGQGDK